MARHSRFLSENNIYHIVLKGINGEQIFFDNGDCNVFLTAFKSACIEHNVEICAYCLMPNHVHLLLKFNEDNMPNLFKSFGAKYVPKYNYNHSRIGPLFNGRYYSSPVDSDEYLFSVIRYIHFNPVNAGICKQVGDYKWSSYNEYHLNNGCFADRTFVESVLSKRKFDELHILDDKALEEFFVQNAKTFGCSYENYEEYVKNHSDEDQDKLIETLKKCGASKRKISKLLEVDIRKI